MTSNGSTTIVYCDDLYHDFVPGGTYDLIPGSVTTNSIGQGLTKTQSSEMGLIAELGRADYLKGDAAGAIAAQAAIWLIEYFYGEASSSTTVYSTNAAIESDIKAFLDLPANPNASYANGFIAIGGGQSQISGDPAVPEASTWAMLAMGFAAMGYAGLHRRRGARPARCALRGSAAWSAFVALPGSSVPAAAAARRPAERQIARVPLGLSFCRRHGKAAAMNPLPPDANRRLRRIPARGLVRTFRGAAVRPDPARPFPARLRGGARAGAPRSRRSPGIRSRRLSPTRSTRSSAAGAALDRVAGVFFNLAGAHSDDALETIEREIAPVLSRHRSEIYQNAALFRRIEALWARRRETLGLAGEQARVLERYRLGFLRAGAALDAAGQGAARRRSTPGSRRWRPSSARTCSPTRRASLLPRRRRRSRRPAGFLSRGAAAAAAEAAAPGGHAITLSRSSVEPFLQFSARRDLREAAFRAWIARGENGGATRQSRDRRRNGQAARRAREAPRFRDLRRTTVSTTRWRRRRAPRSICSNRSGRRARAAARSEARGASGDRRGGGRQFHARALGLALFAEKRRKAEFDLDESQIKPYLQLDRMIEAAFSAASRLFGLSFAERFDIPLYHPDVRAWSVTGPDGAPLALFLGDYFARPSKRSGAWMSQFRGQDKLDGGVRPIVVNVMNFAKAARRARASSASTTPARSSTNSATRCTACCRT